MKLFCTSCQADRAAEGGQRQLRGTIYRWICKACLERRSESIYKSREEKGSYRERRR